MSARILVVEDQELNRELAVRRLERMGYTVRAVENAESAFTAIAAEKPDVVLMDIGLPGMDGLEATRRLKADEATRGVRVIALTAHAMHGDRERAIAAGCDAYVAKPVNFEELDAAIKQVLG